MATLERGRFAPQEYLTLRYFPSSYIPIRELETSNGPCLINYNIGAIHGKASRFCRGAGLGTKYPRLRSEKNMTGTWYVFLTYGGFFFFFVRGILGFQLVKGKS